MNGSNKNQAREGGPVVSQEDEEDQGVDSPAVDGCWFIQGGLKLEWVGGMETTTTVYKS